MYTIRDFDFTDSDYEAIVAVHNAEWPDRPVTVASWKYEFENRNKEYLSQTFVVESPIGSSGEKQIVASCGVSESAWAYVAGKYNIGFTIHPDFEEQGIDEQLCSHAVDFLNQREPKPIMFDAFIREDRTERVKFWTNHGFKTVLREPTSELIVTDYDFSRFERAFGRVAAQGIEIANLPTLQKRCPDWPQRAYHIIVTVDNDIPTADAQTPQPLEEFMKETRHPNFLPEANFFAIDGDEWVGVSTLWKTASEKCLSVDITGVLTSHRRKGIATALKLKTIEFAINYGATTIKTGNEENNPMYDLNIMLGFKPKPAWLEMRKMLVETTK
ncbi:MAG: GNAT family N-acetyltransferase [Chloroflexota bacterium]